MSSVSRLVLALSLTLGLAAFAHSQFFDPELDDKTYLDQIEERISLEVERSALDLVEQSKVAEKVTKSYIAIKLKDNVFKVRVKYKNAQIIE